MKSFARLGLVALVSVIVLSGCVRMQMSLELNEDDTASGTYVFALQEGLGESLGAATDSEAVDELFGMASGEIDGATVTEYNEDGFVGTQIEFEDQTFAELNLDSEDLKIIRDGDDYVVAGAFQQSEAASMGELPADAEMTLAITFPGSIVEANGTVVGNTVTWDLADAPDALYARGGASADGGFPLLGWLAIGFVLLVVLAGVVLLIMGTRRSSPEVPEAEASGAIDAGEASSPPTVEGPPLP